MGEIQLTNEEKIQSSETDPEKTERVEFMGKDIKTVIIDDFIYS